jgi:DNA-binding winged helix-turn-helix (wHTH) protein
MHFHSNTPGDRHGAVAEELCHLDKPSFPVGRFTLIPFRQLIEGGQPVSIGLKSLKLLSVLAQAHGDLVTKDELMDAVWPNLTVEENALQVHIVSLRRVLGPDRGLLCTCHGLGYRLALTPACTTWPSASLEGQRRFTSVTVTTSAVLFAALAGACLVLMKVARQGSPSD